MTFGTYKTLGICGMAMIAVLCGGMCGDRHEAWAGDNSALFVPRCAPWNGDALGVSFPVGGTGTEFQGMIWGKGLAAFRAGKAFTLDNVESPEGTGRAEIVVMKRSPDMAPDITKVTARFDPPAREGGAWTVTVKLPDHPDQDLIYFVRPVMSGAHQQICG